MWRAFVSICVGDNRIVIRTCYGLGRGVGDGGAR